MNDRKLEAVLPMPSASSSPSPLLHLLVQSRNKSVNFIYRKMMLCSGCVKESIRENPFENTPPFLIFQESELLTQLTSLLVAI